MYIVINKKDLIQALRKLPSNLQFALHNIGEYGEYCISLEDHDKERKKYFEKFVNDCIDLGEYKYFPRCGNPEPEDK